MIRRANERELLLISRYANIVQHEATLGYAVHTKNMNSKEMQQFYKSHYLVFVEKGILKGWILVGETITSFTNEIAGIILELYVIGEYRKRGIAQKLMNFALDDLRYRGLKKVQLNVFSGNKAKTFYENFGFHDVVTLMERSL